MRKISKIFPILSLTLGSIGTIWGLLFWFLPGELGVNLFGYYDWQLPFYCLIFLFGSIIGMSFGIITKKIAPEKKKLATIGSLVSFFSLLIWLIICFFMISFLTY